MTELHIFPCADTLLYFPLYLAIDLLRYAKHDTTKFIRKKTETESEPIIIQLPKDLVIYLHPPAIKGDKGAIEELIEFSKTNGDTSEKVGIALTNPLTALQYNTTTADTDYAPFVINTFINRPALWAVYKKPDKADDHDPIMTALEQTIVQMEKGRFPYVAPTTLTLAYCDVAETNKTIVQTMFKNHKLLAKRIMPKQFGVAEITPVVKDQAHICFTTTPWIYNLPNSWGYEVHEKHVKRLRHIKVIPPIPFPYTGIVTLNIYMETAKTTGSLLQIFLRSLSYAVMFSQRDSSKVVIYLNNRHKLYRSYGLSAMQLNKEDEPLIGSVISKGVGELLANDCLSEFPAIPWSGWEFAYFLDWLQKKKMNVEDQLSQPVPEPDYKNYYGQWKTRAAKHNNKIYNFLNLTDYADELQYVRYKFMNSLK